MTETQQIVKEFLNKCGIVFEDYKMLDGMLIPRETLLSQEKYENIKEDLIKMKKMYSSGALTALQKSAETKQKWPLLNLVRQILKSNNYKMDPIRKSNGYTNEGKKEIFAIFYYQKIKSTKEVEVEVN